MIQTHIIINLIKNIKTLIYIEDKSIFEKIDFDDDTIYLEPLLFAYFNSKKDNLFPKETLQEMLQGYFINKEELKIKYSYNKNGVAYLPKLGYYIDSTKIEDIIKIDNFEILIYPIGLLDFVFWNASNNKIGVYDVNIDKNLLNKNFNFLANAISFIKKSSNQHYNLIIQNCSKIVLFNINPKYTNSFTTFTAHGIAFLNVYQDNYDEVFFVDDIAHQTGHIIFNTLLYTNTSFFRIDENLEVENLLKKKDHRNVKTLIHALYTYYTTFICLDNCINKSLFNESQKQEAIARIGFYLRKCTNDLVNFEKINILYNGIENVFFEQGIDFYNLIKLKYIQMLNKWKDTVEKYNFSNQPYNFDYKKFKNINKTQ